MAVRAVTGDIGSGKSTAAKFLAKHLECELIDADAAAKSLWETDSVKAQALNRWGSDILDSSGKIITARIAEHVFSAKSEHDFCNAMLHPIVMSELRDIAHSHEDIVLEIPLLPEAGRPEWIDSVIYVEAEFPVRAERCRLRGWTPDELTRRESFLLPREKRIAISDIVIHNDGDIDELHKQLKEII